MDYKAINRSFFKEKEKSINDKKMGLVILDNDLIYHEDDPDFPVFSHFPLYERFEKRYQKEKNDIKQQSIEKIINITQENNHKKR